VAPVQRLGVVHSPNESPQSRENRDGTKNIRRHALHCAFAQLHRQLESSENLFFSRQITHPLRLDQEGPNRTEAASSASLVT
jgi:hypothetical protein